MIQGLGFFQKKDCFFEQFPTFGASYGWKLEATGKLGLSGQFIQDGGPDLESDPREV